MKNPVFLSLDLNSWEQTHELAEHLKAEVGGFKVGPRLAIKATAKDWQKLSECGPIFYDPKFYDIPNTMLESIKACVDLGVSYLTIHASCGLKTMTQIKSLEEQINRTSFFKILAVTVLTSFGEDNPIPGFEGLGHQSVAYKLADMTVESGLSGIVCSGEEVEGIAKKHNHLFTVVPGIRLKSDTLDDQVRVMTPNLALAKGAKALVVGRPIINAQDPLKAAQQFKSLCHL